MPVTGSYIGVQYTIFIHSIVLCSQDEEEEESDIEHEELWVGTDLCLQTDALFCLILCHTFCPVAFLFCSANICEISLFKTLIHNQ